MVLQKAASFSLVLVAVVAVALGTIGVSHAEGTGMSLTATAQDGSDTIAVTGKTLLSSDISIVVEAPNKNKIFFAQVMPDADGMFGTDVMIGGPHWMQDGLYTITAQQGSSSLYELSVRVQIIDGLAFATDETQSTFKNTMTGQKDDMYEKIGLKITADAMEGSNLITIIGSTDQMQTPISFTVTSPNGNIISVDQTTPDAHGDFIIDIITGGALWVQDGDYTITARQGSDPMYASSVQVEIQDGVVIPEFGAVAVLILGVAIISIIAVSARSRLSIMSKY